MFDSSSGFVVGLCLRRWRRRFGVVGVVGVVLASVLAVVPSGGVGAVGGVSAPSGLSAVSVEGGVLLSWDAPESGVVSGYRVFRRLPESGERRLSVLVSDTGSSETSFLDGSAVEGELLVYRVAALFDGVVGEGSVRARVRYEVSEPVLRAVEPEPEPDVVLLSGVLGVGAHEGSFPQLSGYSRWARVGSLSVDRFAVEGVFYRVLVLVVHADGLYLGVDRALPSDFALTVSGERFVASESLVPPLPVRGGYWWPLDSALWAVDDVVEVTLSMEGSGSVDSRASAPPSAYFADVPERHEGTGPLELRLYFDEPGLDVSAEMLRDHALEVTGGSVSGVRAATRAGNAWIVTVDPAGTGDIVVALSAAVDCALVSAVCSSDGRMLRNRAEAVIAGLSSDASLSFLDVGGLALSPVFDPEVTLYTAEAPAGTDTVTADAVAGDPDAVVEFSPADADAGVGGHQVALVAGGQTAVTVTVTAADGSVRRYWTLISVPADTVPDPGESEAPPQLSELQLGGLEPVEFTPEQTRYEVEAKPDVAETTVVLGLEEQGATIEVLTARGDDPTLVLDPADVDISAEGHQAQLSTTGDTLVVVRVTSADGLRQKIYVVLVRGIGSAPAGLGGAPVPKNGAGIDLSSLLRSAGAQALVPRVGVPTLSSLSLDGVTLDQPFAAATTDYTASVGADVSYVTVAATGASGASVTITPNDADTGTGGHQIALVAGEPGGEATMTAIAVIVRATDGSLNAYIVTVSREAPPSDDATLSALSISDATLSPTFDSVTTDYESAVANATSQVTVTAAGTDDGAAAAIAPSDADANTDGHQVDLAEGPNTITVTVTAANGTDVLAYTVEVFRDAAADNATLTALSLEGIELSPAFAADTHSYAATVDNSVAQVTLNLATAHTSSTVQVVPADSDPNTAGYQIPLTAPDAGGTPAVTAVAIIVTAADTTTRQTYVVDVTRTATGVEDLLPDKCNLGATVDTIGTFYQSTSFVHRCQSILDYKEFKYDPVGSRIHGWARFYKLQIAEDATSVQIEMTGIFTSHHYLVRDAQGAVVAHVFYQVDNPNGASCEEYELGIPCSSVSLLETRLDSGTYIVELIQHYRTGRFWPRAFNVQIDIGAGGPDIPADITTSESVSPGGVPTLSSLSLEGVTLDQPFAAATTDYTASVGADVSYVTVAATGASGASVTITPNDADTGTGGHQIALVAGEPGGEATMTAIAVIVRATDGSLNAYTVTVSREAPPSDDATLSALSISEATLSPTFDSVTTDYESAVANATSQVTVTAAGTDDGADAAIAPPDADANTDGHQVDLAEGPNTITVTVTAANGTDVLAYTVEVFREAAVDNATLTALSLDGIELSPAFAAGTHSYAATVDNSVAEVTLNLATAHTSATVQVVPADSDPNTAGYQIPLTAPDAGGTPAVTAVAIIVTAADTTTRQTYVVDVTRNATTVEDLLPNKCNLGATVDTIGTFYQSTSFVRRCLSILDYKEFKYDPVGSRIHGWARFYKLQIAEDATSVQIEMTGIFTSHHYLVRDAQGAVVAHVFYQVDNPNGASCEEYELGIPCSSVSLLETRLDSGTYIVELIQHYRNGRWWPRAFNVQIDIGAGGAEIPADVTTSASVSPGAETFTASRPSATATGSGSSWMRTLVTRSISATPSPATVAGSVIRTCTGCMTSTAH